MSRLGLRCGEVAALALDDLNWRAGQLTVRGKGNRRDMLPLPVDVGQAVADYRQLGRSPRSAGWCSSGSRPAPCPEQWRGCPGRRGRRATWGLGTIYGHLLRRSAVTSMLAAGGSLAEIGQVLRHR